MLRPTGTSLGDASSEVAAAHVAPTIVVCRDASAVMTTVPMPTSGCSRPPSTVRVHRRVRPTPVLEPAVTLKVAGPAEQLSPALSVALRESEYPLPAGSVSVTPIVWLPLTSIVPVIVVNPLRVEFEIVYITVLRVIPGASCS